MKAIQASSRKIPFILYLVCPRNTIYSFMPLTKIGRRLMNNALKSGLKTKFTAHDLKAKGTSDDEGNAQLGAGHIDGRVTESVYRRKPATVKPIK